ncbi:hypothetical protein BTJ39_09180 [Izhakiella australiensis]|uniref:Lysine-N-methylase fliB n=1 Tax=Izhakiella australiensis TaxID=1926881 RepID=A0A1S8YNE6_9GAMM|nr:flagellin lysine-N-methylase [Izhakiella australiensis]OON40564.1 hypothetical protein BTJ39_09180 [Izhakiella australiensis]
MNKEIIVEPLFVKSFQCIGSACRDSCCGGWSITLDKPSTKRYLKSQSIAVKNIASEHIVLTKQTPQNWGYMKLNTEGNCAFLDEQKLCTIQKNMGSKALSHTCSTYPRRKQTYKLDVESSLELSCPEAARLLLTLPQAMRLDKRESAQITSLASPARDQSKQLINLMCSLLVQQAGSEVNEGLYAIAMLFLSLDKLSADNEDDKLAQLESKFGDIMAALEAGQLGQKIEQIKPDYQLQWSLLMLIQVFLESRPTTRGLPRLRHFVGQLLFLQTQSIDDGDVVTSMQRLDDVWQQQVLPWLRERPHLMSNLMQYRIWHDQFPGYAGRSALSCLYLLTAEWFLIKSLIAAQVAVNGQLDEDTVIDIVYSFHTITKHNSTVMEGFFKRIDKVKVNDDLSLLYLLK